MADIGNDVPLLVAARVGASSYVRLLLQFRAPPAWISGLVWEHPHGQ